MKVVIDKEIPFIARRLPRDVETCYLKGEEITREALKDADALIVRTRTRCDARLLEGTNVKFVATATIGTDHIDTEWCEQNGVKVASAPGCNAPGVAQYVFSSLFSEGFDPHNDTLGIIGYGNVGRIVADWARKMNIRTLINDTPRKEAGYTDIEYLPIEKVLSQSDAVTLHVPLTRGGDYPTFRLLGKDDLALMKKGAILVNSSRGGVVDESALKNKLRSGELKAIIDVWEKEPEIDAELAELAEVATPHIAGYSRQGKMRATRMVLEALEKFSGVKVDTRGLECVPSGRSAISKQLITASYNPEGDHRNLLRNTGEFESLRNNYSYRDEPLFSINEK